MRTASASVRATSTRPSLYITVRAAKDPADIVVNLKAPLVVWERVGHQVLNQPGRSLQAPLFAAGETSQDAAESSHAGRRLAIRNTLALC